MRSIVPISLFLLIIKGDNCKFCEKRSKSSVEVYSGGNFHGLAPVPLRETVTDHDRYSHEIELYGWNFMKDD